MSTAGAAPLLPPTRTSGQLVVLLSAPQAQGRWGHGLEWQGRPGWRRPHLLGAWSPVPRSEVWPCRGPRFRGGAQAHLGHYVCPFTPLPAGQWMPQGWADVAWPHPACPFGPRHQQEGRGGREAGLSPAKGRCPLWASASVSVSCRASCPPSRFESLAWALARGCRVALCCSWPTRRPGPAHGLCVSGWQGPGYGWQGTGRPGLGEPAPWQENSKHCTLKPKAP